MLRVFYAECHCPACYYAECRGAQITGYCGNVGNDEKHTAKIFQNVKFPKKFYNICPWEGVTIGLVKVASSCSEPVANVIKLVTDVSYNLYNKLERFALASLSSLV